MTILTLNKQPIACRCLSVILCFASCDGKKKPLEAIGSKFFLKTFTEIHKKTSVWESLLAMLKKRLQHRCFLVNFAKFLKKTPYDCFRIEYKSNNTKMIRVNIKLNYIIPHFIQFSKELLLFISVEGDIQKQPFTDVLQIGVLKS